MSSSFQTLLHTTAIQSAARRVFAGDNTLHTSTLFKPFPPKPSPARNFIYRFPNPPQRISKPFSSPEDHFDSLLSEALDLYKTISSTEIPLVSERFSISNQLNVERHPSQWTIHSQQLYVSPNCFCLSGFFLTKRGYEWVLVVSSLPLISRAFFISDTYLSHLRLRKKSIRTISPKDPGRP